MPHQPKATLTVEMPYELAERLRAKAAEMTLSASSALRLAVISWLDAPDTN